MIQPRGNKPYKPLSDAKPEVSYGNSIAATIRQQRYQEYLDQGTIKTEGLCQRVSIALTTLTEMGLPGSTSVEVIRLLPIRGLYGFVGRRKHEEDRETANVSWHTTLKKTSYLGYENRKLVVQDIANGYYLGWNTKVYGESHRRYLLTSGLVGTDLSMRNIEFDPYNLHFWYRGCVGVLEDRLIPLEKYEGLDEESVVTLEELADEYATQPTTPEWHLP